jgi:hypothetical protein
VILQKCAPGLRGRLAAAHHIFAHAALPDVDAEFEQFAVKIEDRVARSVVREISIGENYKRNITPIRSNISRFSRGTVARSELIFGTLAYYFGFKWEQVMENAGLVNTSQERGKLFTDWGRLFEKITARRGTSERTRYSHCGLEEPHGLRR